LLPADCLPQGLRLPQASLFFASPKKSKQKKGEPKAVALSGCLALLASRGVGRKLATLRQAPALIRPPLRCSARPMAQGARIPRVLVRCAHIAHASWRAARAAVAAVTFGTTSTTAPTAAATPIINPFTTTESFPNRGQQTRLAAPRFKNTSPKQRNQIGSSSSPSPRRGGSGG
jgi:hypothetical protein